MLAQGLPIRGLEIGYRVQNERSSCRVAFGMPLSQQLAMHDVGRGARGEELCQMRSSCVVSKHFLVFPKPEAITQG